MGPVAPSHFLFSLCYNLKRKSEQQLDFGTFAIFAHSYSRCLGSGQTTLLDMNVFCILCLSAAGRQWKHHGGARPWTHSLRGRAASRSPGDSWHQYAGSGPQTARHAPRTPRHHQGPHAGRHRGALWRLGESPGRLFFSPILIAEWHFFSFFSAQLPRSICHFFLHSSSSSSSSGLVTGWHGNWNHIKLWNACLKL